MKAKPVAQTAQSLLEKLGGVSTPLDLPGAQIEEDYLALERWVCGCKPKTEREAALIGAKTSIYFCFVFADRDSENLAGFTRHLEEARRCLQEYLGLVPCEYAARERARWTEHWVSLYNNPGLSKKEQQAIIRVARRKYPDFDTNVLKNAGS